MNQIDEYISKAPADQAEALQAIRRAITEMAPEVEEAISYGMPGFTYRGKYLITYAAFKDHMSVFPGSEAVEEFKDQLTGFKTSKGTIQFTTDNPLPSRLLEEIVRLSIQRIEKDS